MGRMSALWYAHTVPGLIPNDFIFLLDSKDKNYLSSAVHVVNIEKHVTARPIVIQSASRYQTYV